MKRVFIAGLFLVAAAAGLVAGGGKDAQVADPASLIEPEALRSFVADIPEGAYLVDVRTAEEYVSGHIPGAIQIDYREIGVKPPTEDKDALIVVYCRSGNRSNAATQTLIANGYTNVLDWGGINRWPYDVVMGPDPK